MTCGDCVFSVYDELIDGYLCEAYIDEDEAYRLSQSNKPCPYFREGGDYSLARKQ